MPVIKLKWNKEEFDVEVEDGTTVELFKTQVWTLTRVPVDRQKYLGFPGGMLKDTDDLGAKVAKLKPGQKVQLMGTAEGNELKAPTEKVVFEEDLTPEEKAKILKEKKVEVMPAGIKNLGNTCYMNSVVQCLNANKDLREALEKFQTPPAEGRSVDAVLTAQFRQLLCHDLTATTDSITPLQFVMALRQRFPRFAEMQNGGYMQQDADECLRGMLTVLSQTLTSGSGNRIDELFGFQLQSKLKCLECDEEAPTESTEDQRVLICHLGTQTEPVTHIHQGVALSLKEHIEKNSPTLGRNAQYEKSSCLATLPPFLVVQYARFGYKTANEWAGTSASKVKLTRKCSFSPMFDLFDCASPELKKKLSVGRVKRKEQEDRKLELERLQKVGKLGDGKSAGSSAAPKEGDGDVEMKSAEGDSKDVEMAPAETYDTGYYELIAIVSHKGRTADGGHYVGWTLKNKADGKEYKEDRWLCFDDETVTAHDWKDMVGLSTDLQGGKADTQIAYINFYKKVVVREEGHVLGDGKEGEAKADAPAASS
eukprot:TRINITY_DN31771_c0_g1_i1.p1 TRINITY_DN31771_c0_g1~~TRINITY_DN31771_c0_g1_i1.p1  ORF type:complete len:537 (+),score=168.46 TRINITY_DN31771_c0_g1_i1:107-1717(+)